MDHGRCKRGQGRVTWVAGHVDVGDYLGSNLGKIFVIAATGPPPSGSRFKEEMDMIGLYDEGVEVEVVAGADSFERVEEQSAFDGSEVEGSTACAEDWEEDASWSSIRRRSVMGR
jgi:hypothetical protein